MRSKNKNRNIIVLLVLVLLMTSCAKNLKNDKGKPVRNPKTGQNMVENIICQPENKDVRKLYEDNKVDLNKLPKCNQFKPGSGAYEGLFNSILVKPLAYIIIKIAGLVNNYGLSIIIVTILVRLLLVPLMTKQLKQSEQMKHIQPDIKKIEKKYENKKDQESLMKKSMEINELYRKYNFNPFTSFLSSILSLVILLSFYEAILRIPAIYEDPFLVFDLASSAFVGLKLHNYWYIILIILNGLITYFSMKKNEEMNPMPYPGMNIMMTTMLIFVSFMVPTAVLLYWITQNIFNLIQTYIISSREVKHGNL